MQFDLNTPDGWQALATEWRARRARWFAAVEAFSACERAAQAEIGSAPADMSEADKEAIRERHGQSAADGAVNDTSDATDDLVALALGHAAPTLAAFRCKLEMLGHREGISDFQAADAEGDAWETFIADVRRFVGELPGADTACPVAAIADRITEATAIAERVEREDFDENYRAKSIYQTMADAHDALVMLATLERATTVKGALLQVGLAFDALKEIETALTSRFEREEVERLKLRDDPETEGVASALFIERRETLSMQRKAERALFSVAHFLGSLPGGGEPNPAALFMPAHLDPFNAGADDQSAARHSAAA